MHKNNKTTFLGVFYSCLSTAVVDPLISGLLYHATAHVKILKYNLINLQLHYNTKQNLLEDAVYKQIKVSVKHYAEVLK